MKAPRVTLEQWYTLQTVIDSGGYAQAAEKLHKSQSSISYTISKLQEQLGVNLLRLEGRKAILTDAGQALLGRARHLVTEAKELESLANTISEGWETEITLVADSACPPDLLMKSLKEFEPQSQGTRIQLREVVLSGGTDALLSNQTDIGITAWVPPGFLGDELLRLELVAVAHSDHPLINKRKSLTTSDLVPYRQVVISDSGDKRQMNKGWQDAEQQWKVSTIDTAVEAVANGLGYCWLPRHRIQKLIDKGVLKELNLREGKSFSGSLYIIFGRPNNVGPATRKLADIIKSKVAELDYKL